MFLFEVKWVQRLKVNISVGRRLIMWNCNNDLYSSGAGGDRAGGGGSSAAVQVSLDFQL